MPSRDATPGAEVDDGRALVVRRRIRARPEVLFAAWTEPAQLVRWWGPRGVTCVAAEIDLRPGGGYRIANQFPDGRVVWISGVFQIIEPPRRLVYSWALDPHAGPPERVTIQFDPVAGGTEVVVIHTRIPDDAVRRAHAAGWSGCLDGLAAYVT